MNRSSITDTQDFRDACREAATNINSPFKRDPRIIDVLEHVDDRTGAAYLDVVSSQTPELIASLSTFTHQDDIGHARIVDYGSRGNVSPNTCRYVKVLSDILVMFPQLLQRGALDIVEIGGGYGGQAFVLASWIDISSYTIIDLPEVGSLQKQYLGLLHPTLPLNLLDADRFERFDGADLLISNYALSECRRPIARGYIDSVANACGSGYLTCNYKDETCPDERDFTSWIAAAIRRDPEVPNTDPENYILSWGR